MKRIAALLESPRFQAFMASVIVFNAALSPEQREVLMLGESFEIDPVSTTTVVSHLSPTRLTPAGAATRCTTASVRRNWAACGGGRGSSSRRSLPGATRPGCEALRGLGVRLCNHLSVIISVVHVVVRKGCGLCGFPPFSRRG